jgi:hypothetical protein
LALFPPPFKPGPRRFRDSGEELPPVVDDKVGELLRRFQTTNRAFDVSKLKLDAPEERKGKSSAAEKIIRKNKLDQEKKHAEKDVARLLQGDVNIVNVAAHSATGELAHRMLLILHFWKSGSKSEALDIWLDLGYDQRSLVALLNSDDEIVPSGDSFIIPELLEPVYEKCRPVLVELLAFLKALPDLTLYQVKEMGDRLIPLNWNLFHNHRC